MMKICCKNRYENLRKSLLENSLRRLYYSKKEKVVKPQPKALVYTAGLHYSKKEKVVKPQLG